MQVQPEITFRDVPRSRALTELIEKKVRKLDQHCPELLSCRVAVEAPHRSKGSAPRYNVRIDMTVPSRELVVNGVLRDIERSKDLQAAVRTAFERAERQLREYSSRRRRDVKQHEHASVGVVARIIPNEGKGYIQTPDGREFYFEREAVLDGGFSELQPGDVVGFAEPGDDRPLHAHSVIRRAPADPTNPAAAE